MKSLVGCLKEDWLKVNFIWFPFMLILAFHGLRSLHSNFQVAPLLIHQFLHFSKAHLIEIWIEKLYLRILNSKYQSLLFIVWFPLFYQESSCLELLSLMSRAKTQLFNQVENQVFLKTNLVIKLIISQAIGLFEFDEVIQGFHFQRKE